MSRFRISTLLLSVLLAACAAPSAVRAPAVHDFGPGGVPASAKPSLPLSRIEVIAPVWLATNAMQYRLLGRGETERHSFADNRWAATPAQLLEQRLQRRLPQRSDSRCKLQLRLDELIQEFGADGSRLRLAGTARLVGERGEDLVEGLAFDYRQKAGSADAAGGVRATAEAAARLDGELLAWLGQARPGLCSPR